MTTDIVDVVVSLEESEGKCIAHTSQGHTFWLNNPSTWIVLKDEDLEFFTAGQRVLNSMLGGLAQMGQGMGVEVGIALRVIRTLFQSQMRELDEENLEVLLGEMSKEGPTTA